MSEMKKSEGWMAYIKPLGIGVSVGLLLTALCMVLFAAILAAYDVSDFLVTVFSLTALVLGAVAAGFTASKLYGKNGLLIGMVVGVVLFALILLVSLAINPQSVTIQTLIKLVVTVLCAGLGGILGVNLKRRKKLI